MTKRNPYLDERSLPSKFRRRRFSAFLRMIEVSIAQNGRCHILDLGGTEYYWRLHDDMLVRFGDKLHVYLVNLDELHDVAVMTSPHTAVRADITDPTTYTLVEYDLIHSNSVIEHVGGWPAIKQMADCIVSSGRPSFVQTPNYWFPLEPHFRVLGWQWLPESWRASLLLRNSKGFFPKSRSYEEAMMHVEGIKLLTSSQLHRLFPNSVIAREWMGPFVKSFIVIDATKRTLA